MEAQTLQRQVAQKIQELYRIAGELEALFPGRHYTPDGHMIGSIGEALAASCYGLELYKAGEKTHDAKAPDGRQVQIKATQIDRVALSSEPQWLLVLKIYADGSFAEAYNGPGDLVWHHCTARRGNPKPKPKNGQYPISLAALRRLQQKVPEDARLPRIG